MPFKKLVICLALFMLTGFVRGASHDLEKDPFPLFYLQRNLTHILINDNVSPPVASRFYVYPNLAANCVLSLASKTPGVCAAIKGFPAPPKITDGMHFSPSLASSFAFFETARKLIYTTQPFRDSFEILIQWYKREIKDNDVFEQSKKIGQQTADAILQWLDQDRFNETRAMNKYVLLRDPGKWQLTAPGYFAAVEPHFGELRPLLTPAAPGIDQLLPINFDTSAVSGFRAEALNVRNTVNNLSDEQKLIASFWDCNPYALKPVGHINMIVKKISPGGHWMSIAGIACRMKNYDLSQSSDAFALCAVAIYDAFVFTWKKKYEYSSLRPETYIQQFGIDENWEPFIQSPPFPEFPSGHAVISNSAACILTHLFGKDFAYWDDTEADFGISPRHFSSFDAAAEEATISRVYGGIHFSFSCLTGQQMGKMLGAEILSKMEAVVK